MSMDIFFRACVFPKKALRSLTTIFAGVRLPGRLKRRADGSPITRTRDSSAFDISLPCNDAEDHVQQENKCYKDERRRPRLPVPVRERCPGVIVDKNGQRCNRLADRRRPEPVSQGGEQEGRGFSGGACKRQ